MDRTDSPGDFMDLASIFIVAALIVLCAFPFIIGAFRGLDRKADELESRDPETSKALRKAREDIDRGKGYYGPRQ
ncbi:hypothetical protein AAHB37_05470 [Glutamicibacter halophytocola]|uniref:hypothetical protein n=1 Tax=Glutamicibacter halophytocola TaxID=1933880 RepID=UPI003218EAD1